jgi:hypothetical protein
VILGAFGITAHSASLPATHPMYRANTLHI